jgi:DNA-directed RNA polymerase specialized sigma24 family protein
MSSFVGWIAAEADDDEGDDDWQVGAGGDDEFRREPAAKDSSWRRLPEHNFPAELRAVREELQESALDRNPDLWLYRKRTTALLRRYMRLSIETGRLPSVIGREVFRAKITTYTATTFEDRVIFVHDIERCLERLSSFDQEIIARLVLQEYDHVRAARILHCTRRTIERRLPEILDELSEEFLKSRLLVPLPQAKEKTE